ncbi:hypothetical protein PCANC_26222 [Puccinia coronata f. sp. avenae]|uniref:Uncharacterized protein n=1 Tax=Puccinia coronata f. sp. avenae TaxID=200324 RepID=A0A2N5S5N2_9BASI|nr:hypothetical protein PCANC_26222 [Puccinia coronata f. sp. avenae]
MARHPARPALGQIQPIQLPHIDQWHPACPALGQIQPIQLPHSSQLSAHSAPQKTHTLSPSSSCHNGKASSPARSHHNGKAPPSASGSRNSRALATIQPPSSVNYAAQSALEAIHITQLWRASSSPSSRKYTDHPAPPVISWQPTQLLKSQIRSFHPAPVTMGSIQPFQLQATSSRPSSSFSPLMEDNRKPTHPLKTQNPQAIQL